jgi:hypothetical protein
MRKNKQLIKVTLGVDSYNGGLQIKTKSNFAHLPLLALIAF